MDENTSSLINNYIDCCILNKNSSHYDISLTVYEILKKKYRYNGLNIWEYFDDINNIWCIDEKCIHLKNDIQTIVCDNFLRRALYWDNKNEGSDNINININCKLRSEKLLSCSNNLKNDKYISIIIKESRALFDYCKNN